jgi:hypothetical protein
MLIVLGLPGSHLHMIFLLVYEMTMVPIGILYLPRILINLAGVQK